MKKLMIFAVSLIILSLDSLKADDPMHDYELVVDIKNNISGNTITVQATRIIDREAELFYSCWKDTSAGLNGKFEISNNSDFLGDMMTSTSLSYRFGVAHWACNEHPSRPDSILLGWGLYKLVVFNETTGYRDSIFTDWVDQNFKTSVSVLAEDVYIEYYANTRSFKYGFGPKNGQPILNGTTVGCWEWYTDVPPTYTREYYKFTPAIPHHFQLVRGNNNHPFLSWSSTESFPLEFDVYRGISKIATVTSPNYLDEDFCMGAGTSYAGYYVRASNNVYDPGYPGRRKSNPTNTITVKGNWTLKAVNNSIPNSFVLSQNYPNPFNPSTFIDFSIPEKTKVELMIYNILGERVRNLLSEYKEPGDYSIIWDGRDNSGKAMPSGIYLYRIVAGNFIKTHRMTLLK